MTIDWEAIKRLSFRLAIGETNLLLDFTINIQFD